MLLIALERLSCVMYKQSQLRLLIYISSEAVAPVIISTQLSCNDRFVEFCCRESGTC